MVRNFLSSFQIPSVFLCKSLGSYGLLFTCLQKNRISVHFLLCHDQQDGVTQVCVVSSLTGVCCDWKSVGFRFHSVFKKQSLASGIKYVPRNLVQFLFQCWRLCGLIQSLSCRFWLCIWYEGDELGNVSKELGLTSSISFNSSGYFCWVAEMC